MRSYFLYIFFVCSCLGISICTFADTFTDGFESGSIDSNHWSQHSWNDGGTIKVIRGPDDRHGYRAVFSDIAQSSGAALGYPRKTGINLLSGRTTVGCWLKHKGIGWAFCFTDIAVLENQDPRKSKRTLRFVISEDGKLVPYVDDVRMSVIAPARSIDLDSWHHYAIAIRPVGLQIFDCSFYVDGVMCGSTRVNLGGVMKTGSVFVYFEAYDEGLQVAKPIINPWPIVPQSFQAAPTAKSTVNLNTDVYGELDDVSISYGSLGFDRLAPYDCRVIINDGDGYTSSTSVKLTLYAQDDESGVTYMAFSNDGVTYSWELYYTVRENWVLTPANGAKTVYAKFRDEVGNESLPAYDTIVLVDSNDVPAYSIVVNNGDEYTNSRFVTLRLSATTGGPAIVSMRFSNDGNKYSYWEPYSELRENWELSPSDGIKTIYVQFMDLAGNISPPAYTTVVLDTEPTYECRILINDGAKYTNSEYVKLTLYARFDGAPAISMRFSNDNIQYSGWETYGTERENWQIPAIGGKLVTVYAQFRDAAGNISAPVCYSVTFDSGQPYGSVIINGGAMYTNSENVRLKLSAWDDETGVRSVRIYGDDVASIIEQLLSGAHYVTEECECQLIGGPGKKTVYAVFRDELNESESSYDEITLVPPWDVNEDGVVNYSDFIVVGQNFGDSPEDLRADVNKDAKVDIFDLVITVQHFGESYIAESN